MAQLATRSQSKAVARPLKVLVPLIAGELTAGDTVAREHYRRAGELLLEARDQVAAFKWGAWLSKNFALSRVTAWRYMKMAEKIHADPSIVSHGKQPSMRQTIRPNEGYAHVHWRPVIDATKQINVDEFAEVRQARNQEIELHRELALELIDVGFKALATRLHPDRGGSKDAMRRLNRVRDELKAVAESRRFA
jgi:hypothetical protein